MIFFKRFLPVAFFVAVLTLLYGVLVTPNRLSWIGPQSFTVLPVELVALGLMLLIPGTVGVLVRWLVAALLAAGAVFKLADMTTYQIFARPFNPVFDAYLLVNGMDLLKGALGKFAAFGICLLLLVIAASITAFTFLMLGYLRRKLTRKPKVSAALMLGLALAWGLLRVMESPHASTQFASQLAAHVQAINHSIRDRAQFAHELQADKPKASHEGIFEHLKNKHVLIVFIESYGRTLFNKPEFAGGIKPAWQEHSARLDRAGLEVRTAWLRSPTVGGLSWLAHATAMSGLWIDSQTRYDTLVTSKHQSLNNLFRAAGWRTVGVMPAITMAWPEGNYFGYDQLYHAYNSGYAGKPFNWVTMPDQFTLSQFHRAELEGSPAKPVMAEIALISSHAPWTPVPTLVPWDQVGDGKIFDAQATSGASPETVWSDPKRIRTQFRLAIEYSVATLVDYLVTYGSDDLVVIALGDHQPAPLVTEDSDNRDVPVHVFARDPNIIRAIETWQWAGGMVPADAGPVWGMDELRSRLLSAFSAQPSGSSP